MEFLANPDLKNVAALATAATKVLVVDGANNTVKTNTPAQIVAGLDGDKGDITVSSSGATWTIDNDVVTYAKMQNVSATSRVLGRKTASAGDTEECTLSEVLDFVGSAAQGDILYRGASTWTRLGAGTSGQYLKTQGSGANPVWANVTASSAYRADFAFSRGDSVTSLSIPSSSEPSNGTVVWPFQYNEPIGTVFQTTFVPTNYQITMMLYNEISTGDVPSAIGFKLQYSTNNSTWTDVYSWDIRGAAGYRSTSGSLSITGSPANVYYRLHMYNPSFNNSQVVNALGLTLSLWN